MERVQVPRWWQRCRAWPGKQPQVEDMAVMDLNISITPLLGHMCSIYLFIGASVLPQFHVHRGFAECVWHSIKSLSSVTLGKEHTVNFWSVNGSLPSVTK